MMQLNTDLLLYFIPQYSVAFYKLAYDLEHMYSQKLEIPKNVYILNQMQILLEIIVLLF